MIEKALIVIIFMYSITFGLLAAQYTLADIYGVTLTNWQGDELKNPILQIADTSGLNTILTNVTSTDPTALQTDPITAAAQITYQLFLILTGTYVFNVLYFLGVPFIVVSGLAIIYLILLARALIGYLRGV